MNTVEWMRLSKDTRNTLRQLFGIPMSGSGWVKDNVQVQDGVTELDLQAITQERLMTYLGHDGNYDDLLKETIAQVEGTLFISERFQGIQELPEEIKEDMGEKTQEPMKCEDCEFVGKNTKAIRMHSTRKHAK